MASSGQIKPGEKGAVRVTVDVANRTGPMMKSVQVVSNDPQKRILSLSLRMFIKGPDTPQAQQR